MPDYFSHQVAAEIIYEKLGCGCKKQLNKDLYLIGAQGGDVFFAYSIKPTKSNLGRNLHRKNAIYLFNKLIEGDLSYAAGFATHYALDSGLHPIIYRYENSKHSPFAHNRLESDFGLYLSRKYSVRRSILPLEKLLANTGAIYDSIKLVEPLVTVTGIERCLKRHFTYTKFLYKTKKLEYKCDFPLTETNEDIENAVETGLLAVNCVMQKRIDTDIFSKEFLQK